MVNRHDDGNSRLQQLGYQPNENPLRSRIGTRQLDTADARFRLDRIHQSELLEEQGPPGPACSGPRIMWEPAVRNFQLNRGAKTYDGSSKPEDWLTDYVTTISIAGGNKRWAVRYVP